MGLQNRQSGQILLIMLLVMSIAMTVVLSLLGRSTTDSAISSQLEESARAFSAAEAGIETALKSGVGTTSAQTLSAGVTYNVSVATIGGATGPYQLPKKTSRGTTETIWLVNHLANGSLIESPTYTGPSIDLCWSSEAVIPAVLVTIFYKESTDGSYRVLKGAYDPDNTRTGTNKFAAPTAIVAGCGAGTGTTYKQTISFAGLNATVDPVVDTLLMLRVQPLYSDTMLAVSPTAGLAVPAQGNRVESTGSTGSGVTRKIVVSQQYRAPLGVFDFGLYSQSAITH